MDEPTTALDVVMQREIVRQIVQLRDQFGFAVIFITYDMSLLLEIADRFAIMYAGKIIEDGGSQEVYRRARHPYTRGLISFPSFAWFSQAFKVFLALRLISLRWVKVARSLSVARVASQNVNIVMSDWLTWALMVMLPTMRLRVSSMISMLMVKLCQKA